VEAEVSIKMQTSTNYLWTPINIDNTSLWI
jgi:hypothetical protein